MPESLFHIAAASVPSAGIVLRPSTSRSSNIHIRTRASFLLRSALPVIPNRSTAIRKAYCPKRFYRRRHKIENFFCRIKDWRRIATRYDKLARNFLAATTLIGALYWIKL